jgi:hypothetical protein
MHFPIQAGQRPRNDKFKNDIKREDEFMKEHGGWGPRLTFLFFEAAFHLPSCIRDSIGRCRQKTRGVILALDLTGPRLQTPGRSSRRVSSSRPDGRSG